MIKFVLIFLISCEAKSSEKKCSCCKNKEKVSQENLSEPTSNKK